MDSVLVFIRMHVVSQKLFNVLLNFSFLVLFFLAIGSLSSTADVNARHVASHSTRKL